MIGTLAYQTVNREVLVLAGGARALLMQLAMPGVAAAVDEWSDFRRRPVRRLCRTLTLSYGLAFGAAHGDDARLRRAAAAINRAHAPIAGEGYSARDPRLLLWVHATLVDSALVAYSAFVRPLTAAEREDYYQASMTTAPLLGLPSSMFPPSYPEFVDYVTTAVATACVVDARARALATRGISAGPQASPRAPAARPGAAGAATRPTTATPRPARVARKPAATTPAAGPR